VFSISVSNLKGKVSSTEKGYNKIFTKHNFLYNRCLCCLFF